MTEVKDMSSLERGPFDAELADIDPAIDKLISLEEERQVRRLIMIPSESLCHPVVRRTMDSVYGNLYAEGYPSSLITTYDEKKLSDFNEQLMIYRRYADRRFYKGTDYINMVESICRRRAADAFANERVSSEGIFANVQALSGAAANLAVQEAFLKPGDKILAMDLMHGGHLSHGSEFHMSGKKYQIISYGINRSTGLLDYAEIERLALEHNPRMIIAGYTSYPWAPDFVKFREIADSCGAILMADIAHPAGLAIAGDYPNPVGIADVTTMTTHKTLMGPRGALILTTDEEKSRMVDNAVFPGEQGGPHVNTITALAVALKIAQTEEFKNIQHKIVRDAQILTKALVDEGLSLAYSGTDTHLFLIDLKKLPALTNEPLSGEMAVRLLELCGIVCNKNTIPGDTITAMASGVRMGTPWISQRGATEDHLKRLAKAVSKLLHNIYPFHYDGLMGTLPRGKVDFRKFEEVKQEVASIAAELDGEAPQHSGFPHYSIMTEAFTLNDENASDAEPETAALYRFPAGVIRVTGERVEAHMQNLVTSDLSNLKEGEAIRTLMLEGDGNVLDDVVVSRIAKRDDTRNNGFYVIPNPRRANVILSWMRGHADGYLLFEPTDITAKVEGPVIVEDLVGSYAPENDEYVLFELRGKDALKIAEKAGEAARILTVKNEDAALLIVPLDDAEAVQVALMDQGAVLCTIKVRDTQRERSGLHTYPLNVSDLVKAGKTEWFDLHKPYFIGQLLVKDAIKAEEKPEFSWEAKETEELKRTTLYEEHAKLTKKLVPFAGWEMPVWYTSGLAEHRAVREKAGLFDISHMGVFEVSGENATDFLDIISTNYSRWVKDNESYYSYLLDINGDVIDDIMVYRMRRDYYLVVVNAGNEDEDWAWFNAVNNNEVLLDREVPHRKVLKPAVLRNLKDRKHGEDCRINIALQGPLTRKILLMLVDEDEQQRLKNLKRTGCAEFTMDGLPVVLSRTGYTGEAMGFEIFVHPDKAPQLWRKILEVGEPYGVVAAGLGARDSLRTEAGLPLYGHELAGPYNMTPHGAGFPSYVKFHKPFFIGKKALLEKEAKRDKITVRFSVPEKGTKPLKPGDPIVNARGDFIGNVTSCAVDTEGLQIGLAYVITKAAKPGKIAVFPMPAESMKKKVSSPLELLDKRKTLLPVNAEIIARFPKKPDAKDLVRTESQIAIETID